MRPRKFGLRKVKNREEEASHEYKYRSCQATLYPLSLVPTAKPSNQLQIQIFRVLPPLSFLV